MLVAEGVGCVNDDGGGHGSGDNRHGHSSFKYRKHLSVFIHYGGRTSKREN